MNIIFDATALRLYPVARPGFSGGTERMLRHLASGLSERHDVHVVAPDLERPEQRGPKEWWWPERAHPLDADAVVLVHNMEALVRTDYNAPLLLVATNGVTPWLGDDPAVTRKMVDAWPVFSECHKHLLVKHNPAVDPSKVVVTGLGTDLPEPPPGRGTLGRVPGRMLYANDPARGLWHVLDIFDHVHRAMPEATLHVAYDFERQFEPYRWQANALAEQLWECHHRMLESDSIVGVGALGSEGLLREQWECHVHAMPSDPPNSGSQIHGLTQLELAATGTPLVLSATEAFPEIFGEAALVLPLPGTYIPSIERRYDCQDWAEAIVELMRDPERWAAASSAARALAERHTWMAVVDRWDAMVEGLLERAGEKSDA